MQCKKCGMPWSADNFYQCSRTVCKPCYREAQRKRTLATPKQKYDRAVMFKRRRVGLAILRWRRDFPAVSAAQSAINAGIRAGKLRRGTCDACGTSQCVFGIPADPARPLDALTWRCAICDRPKRAAKGRT